MHVAPGRWRPWRRTAVPAGSPAGPPRPADPLDPWLAHLAGRLDGVIDELLGPIDDAVTAVREDPDLVGGDELCGRRAAHALAELAGELGGISGALRAGPPGARRR